MPTLPKYTTDAKYFNWKGDSSDPGSVPVRSTISGTRYFHKFDPATSFWMAFGLLSHELDTPYMLYDMGDEDCLNSTPIDISSITGVDKPDYGADTDVIPEQS